MNMAGTIYGVKFEKICKTKWSPNIFQNNLNDREAGLTKWLTTSIIIIKGAK